MSNYNVTATVLKVATGGDIEGKVQDLINSLDNTKVLRSITMARIGADRCMVLVVSDS